MPQLKELLVEQLQDLLHAETQLTGALPNMAEAAHHPKLKEAFEKHLVQTEVHVERLRSAFGLLGEKAEPKPAKDQLNVKDLALTKDASDIEYKTLVEHVVFKSKTNVKSVCAELTANLKAQGWTKEGSDLVTAASSILKRKRGNAALTIFVKPENGGSEVKIFTEGLSWDEK